MPQYDREENTDRYTAAIIFEAIILNQTARQELLTRLDRLLELSGWSQRSGKYQQFYGEGCKRRRKIPQV